MIFGIIIEQKLGSGRTEGAVAAQSVEAVNDHLQFLIEEITHVHHDLIGISRR
ncbi:hypothetical protein D3C86_2188350 [compost metagenome]